MKKITLLFCCLFITSFSLNTMELDNTDYSQMSKKELIARIKQLETMLKQQNQTGDMQSFAEYQRGEIRPRSPELEDEFNPQECNCS